MLRALERSQTSTAGGHGTAAARQPKPPKTTEPDPTRHADRRFPGSAVAATRASRRDRRPPSSARPGGRGLGRRFRHPARRLRWLAGACSLPAKHRPFANSRLVAHGVADERLPLHVSAGRKQERENTASRGLRRLGVRGSSCDQRPDGHSALPARGDLRDRWRPRAGALPSGQRGHPAGSSGSSGLNETALAATKPQSHSRRSSAFGQSSSA